MASYIGLGKGSYETPQTIVISRERDTKAGDIIVTKVPPQLKRENKCGQSSVVNQPATWIFSGGMETVDIRNGGVFLLFSLLYSTPLFIEGPVLHGSIFSFPVLRSWQDTIESHGS